MRDRPFEEIAFLADQLRAATLGLIAAPASLVAGTVAATVRDAVLQLRRPLATGGVALIDASATAIGAVFAGLTTAELQKLAKDFSRLRPLAPFPGWRYNSFLETDELLTLMRYGIWLALSKRPEAEPVVYRGMGEPGSPFTSGIIFKLGDICPWLIWIRTNSPS